MSKYLNREEIEGLLWQIAGKHNWEAVVEVPSFLAIYDRMPDRMRLAVDLKIQGHEIEEIADMMGISSTTAYEHLQKAKNRVMRSITGYFDSSGGEDL